jgi:LPXTG-motif cell wall-anchored protein
VQPTSLPETGATDLAPVLAGAGGLTAGSLAYLRGRKARR